MTSVDYQTITYTGGVWDDELGEFLDVEISVAILSVDENGILTTAHDELSDVNYSNQYLEGKLVIDDGVTSIGAQAFEQSNLTGVIIPESVTRIDFAAFNSSKLTSVTIPSSVVYLGEYSFAYNPLTSVIIKGKSSSADFEWYGEWPFGDDYNYNAIIWQP